jgi:tetratricopeptide (TPR) repeat protein
MIYQLAAKLGVSAQWLATGVDTLPNDIGEIVDAEVALRLGDVDEAERIFQARARIDDPARAAAVAGLGQIAFRAEQLGEAIEQLEFALQLRGGKTLADPSATDTLGRAYAASGALEEAIALFSRALDEARAANAPVEQFRFAVLLSNSLIDQASFPEAEQALAGLINLASDIDDPLAVARVYWSQSRLHVLRQEPQLAARYARRALDILERTEADSYKAMAYHLLAFAEIETGNHESALELLERGRSLFGSDMRERDHAKFALEEARALAGLGRSKEAARAGARAVEFVEYIDDQDRGRAYVTLGDIFMGVGDSERARELYSAGLDLLVEQGKPYVVTAARNLAELLEAEGDVSGALATLKRATEASLQRTRTT